MCLTCRHALYDGMCMAKGKFTTLDAQACDQYAQTAHAELSRLRTENKRLRELVRAMYYSIAPSRREQLLVNVAEFEIEAGE